jgi:nitrite reductase (NADH) small subunit
MSDDIAEERMREIRVGTVAEFEDGACRLVVICGREVGVRIHRGEFYAYENRCIHQGGPACEGVLVGRVTETTSSGGEVLGQSFSEEVVHFVCPWHGFEYDLRTGEFAGDRSKRLHRYEVLVRGEEVYVAG